MNKSLPPEWQAIADDIRSWYAKDATVIYQNAIVATVQRCYVLASTDTAAQTLREKHYEECKLLCRPLGSMVDDQFNKGYLHGCQECQDAIERAKEKP